MIAKAGIFHTHEAALDAVKQLKEKGFEVNKLSVIGKMEIVDNHMSLKSLDPVKSLPLAAGTIAGVVTGLLTGIGIFAIPGFGFLYGAGAVIGIIGGLDAGIIGGGLLSILMHLGISKEDRITYQQHVKAGRFLVVVKGSKKEIESAAHILGQDTRITV